MGVNFQIYSNYINYINYFIFAMLVTFIIFVISFILFEKINKTYNNSITDKKLNKLATKINERKGISTPPSGPNPPKPPKKNWKDKVKEHFSQYKYIYIGVGMVILGGILYISFGNGDPRSGGGATPQTPQTRLNFPNRFNLGAPSGSTFGRSENMQNFMNFASHEALKNKAIDQVYQSAELNQYSGLKTCVNASVKLVFTFNPELNSFGNPEQNLSEIEGLSQNEPMTESLTVEEIDNLISEDIEKSKSEEREPSNFRVLFPTLLERNLDETELDRVVDSMRSSIRTSIHTKLEELSAETQNISSSLFDSTNRNINQRDLRNFLEARNLAYYRDLSQSNYQYYQDQVEERIDRFIQSPKETGSNLYEYRLPDLPTERLDTVIEEASSDNVFNQFNSEWEDRAFNQFHSEWITLNSEIEQLAASQIGSVNADVFTMDDIRYMRDNLHPNLSIDEVIDMLILERIGTPIPLKELIANANLNPDTGYYFLCEETQALIQLFDRSVFQYLFSQLTQGHNIEYVKSSEFFAMIIKYLEKHNFHRLQTVYNRNGDYYDNFIQQLIEDILSNESSIRTFVNNDRDRLHLVLLEITSIVLSEAVESMLYPYVFDYDELNRLIKLCFALEKHLGLALKDIDSLDLLVLCLGTS